MLISAPLIVSAGDIIVSPHQSTVSVGDTFTVNVVVSSPNASINAASALLAFDPSSVEVISLITSNSIINYWVREPVYSNHTGSISFEGVTINAGYKGFAGKLIGVTFRAKKAGVSAIDIRSGSILASDGFGTEVVELLTDGTVNVTARLPQEITPPPPAPPPPAPPTPTTVFAPTEEEAAVTEDSKIVIKSSTHPSDTDWYNNATAELFFELSVGVDAVRTILSQFKDDSPVVIDDPAVYTKKLENISNGTWYFTMEQRIGDVWSGTTTKVFNIDTETPEFVYLDVKDAAGNSFLRKRIMFEARDSISGIKMYQIFIDGRLVEKVLTEGAYEYQTPILPPGTHTVEVRAFDHAGNFVVASIALPTAVISMEVNILFVLSALLVLLLGQWIVRRKVGFYRKRKIKSKRRVYHLLQDEFDALIVNAREHQNILMKILKDKNLSNKELTSISKVINDINKLEISAQKSLNEIHEEVLKEVENKIKDENQS